MNIQDFEFQLTFREASFRWVEGRREGGGPDWFLVEDPEDRYPDFKKTYRPLDSESGLFLNLARDKPTKEHVQRFSHTYGPLVPYVSAIRSDTGAPFTGMPFRSLRIAVNRLRKAIDAWKAGEIRRLVALTVLDFSGFVRATVRQQDDGLTMKLEPKSLADAIWVQFLLGVIEQKEYRECEVCGKWFELAPAINRKSRTYCSNPCRNKALRRRMARAIELRGAGWTIMEIATELDSDPAVVKGWIR